jgi:serine/threonine protein kinase/tetratricopeptide (TPR) repeat protein
MVSVGTKLGPYTILASLGAGGMGEVYRARDSRLGREVAIKVLPEKYAQDADRLARFEREARAVATLEHPNILVLHDVGTEQGITYAVMELLEGETLRSQMSHSPLPWRKVLEIGTAITEGLGAAHAKGIIHRDLKPENIFLCADGRVKILDFGLARMEKSASPLVETGSYESRETDTGTVMGTVGYMAPEQVTGKPVDARTDLFALGCVLYEMLSGQRAFPGGTAAEIQAAILRDDPRPLAKSDKEIPPSFERLIRHCLEKKPESRFQSARDLVFALRDLSTESGMARPFQPDSQKRSLLLAGLITALIILGIVSALVYSWSIFRRPANGPGPAAYAPATSDSVAVLPFENASADPEIDYLCDGTTENVINSLTQLPKLRVIARSTAFTFKGQKIDPQKTGQDLKVRAVLTGTVSQRNNLPVIQVDLVDVVDGVQLWGKQFPLRPSDLVGMQEEIVGQVAEKMEIPLTDELKKRLTRRSTEKGEAYRLYLKGLYYVNKAAQEDLTKALDNFDRALEIDPTFALPRVGKANAYYALSNIYFAPREVMPKVRAAALEALRFDPALGEAHALLGVVNALYDWTWPEAEAEFRRALQLNPGSASTHVYYGVCMASTGRFDESVRELKLTQELDPLSPFIVAYSILPLYFARQHEQAIQQLRSASNLDPKYHMFHAYLGLNYEETGEYSKAIAEFEETIKLEDNTEGKAQLAHAYAVGGRPEDARRLLQNLLELSKNNRYVSAFDIAMIHLGLGEKDRAFEWLHKAAEDHSEWFTYLNVDPRLDSIRKDPRFANLQRKLHLGSPPN